MDGRQVHVRIEHSDWRRVRPELLRRRKQTRRLYGRRRQLRRETTRYCVVNRGRQHTTTRNRRERRSRRRVRTRTTLHQAGNAPCGGGDLERRDRIERDAIADPNHALAVLAEYRFEKT